jgi:hypothetical protein
MNKKQCNQMLCVVVIAVLINLILPQIVVAIKGNDKMNNGSGVWNQIVDMLVHHAHTPVTSSVIVALIVALSMWLCCCCVKL